MAISACSWLLSLLSARDVRSNLCHFDPSFPVRAANVKDLLTTVELSCSTVEGSNATGIVSGGRSRYALPGMVGRPVFPALAVTVRGSVPFTARVRSTPSGDGFQ